MDAEDDPTPRVFLSYSRRDDRFVEWLADVLSARGFVVDWDQASSDPDNVSTGIAAQDEWWVRLKDMIAAADIMVFVVSPDSSMSLVCDEEIAYARAIGKRVVGIMHRPIDFATAPPRLSAMNVRISFADEEADAPLQELVRALSVDVGWHRDATWFTQEALRWNASGDDSDLLLQGSNLDAAERWLLRRPPHAPALPAVVTDFIEASKSLSQQRQALAELQRLRLQAVTRVARPFLEAELSIRRKQQASGHRGIDDTRRRIIRDLQNLLDTPRRWHPKQPLHVRSLGAQDDYSEVYQFPCCGTHALSTEAGGRDLTPSQLHPDGCQDIPAALLYEPPAGPGFDSLLLKGRSS